MNKNTESYWEGYVDALKDFWILLETEQPDLKQDIAPLLTDLVGDRLGEDIDVIEEDNYDTY